MWRWYTAEDRRQAAAVVALIVAVGILVVGVSPLVVIWIIASLGGRGFGRLTDPDAWPGALVEVLARPSQVNETSGWPMPPGMSASTFWLLAATVTCAALAGFVFLATWLYRVIAPTGTGFAGRADIRTELSVAVCRRRAKVTRPEFSRRQRAGMVADHVGIPLHEAPVTRSRLWLPLENATGVIAPQQSGKTLMDLLHKVLAAPGGLIVTSTKLDLFLLTAQARERTGSQVQVLDLTGAVSWPRQLRWNPIRGCVTVKIAKRRAQALLRATTSGGDATGGAVGNHAFFERRAVDVLTAYLLAAALSGATVEEFVGWCQNDSDNEAVRILREFPQYAAVRRTLQQAQAVVEETRSGIWETLRDSITCLTDPEVIAGSLPSSENPGVDPDVVIRSGGTIYVIGSEEDAATQAPLITAFVQDVLDTARRRAIAGSGETGRERLTPPFTAVLDEVASICPLPDLPNTLSDSAGRGLLIHYALQSPAQAQNRWGKAAATLFDNTTALTIFGGLKSEETLKWASLLAGRRLEERRSRQSGRSWTDPGSFHVGTERADTLDPAAVRQIPRGRALLIMRTMPALIVHLRPAWKRRDWRQLSADADGLRRTTITQPDTDRGPNLGTAPEMSVPA